MGCRLEPTPTSCRSLESIQFINHSHRSPFLGQYNNGRGSSAGGLPYWIHDSSQWEMLAAIDYSDRRNATHGRHLAGSRCPQEGSTRPSLLSIIHQIQSNPIQSNPIRLIDLSDSSVQRATHSRPMWNETWKNQSAEERGRVEAWIEPPTRRLIGVGPCDHFLIDFMEWKRTGAMAGVVIRAR